MKRKKVLVCFAPEELLGEAAFWETQKHLNIFSNNFQTTGRAWRSSGVQGWCFLPQLSYITENLSACLVFGSSFQDRGAGGGGLGTASGEGYSGHIPIPPDVSPSPLGSPWWLALPFALMNSSCA